MMGPKKNPLTGCLAAPPYCVDCTDILGCAFFGCGRSESKKVETEEEKAAFMERIRNLK